MDSAMIVWYNHGRQLWEWQTAMGILTLSFID